MGWFAGTEWWVGGGVASRVAQHVPQKLRKNLKMSIKFPFHARKGWTRISQLKKKKKKKDLTKDS